MLTTNRVFAMAALHLGSLRERRKSVPLKASSSQNRLSGSLVLMAALTGIARAISRARETGAVAPTPETQDTLGVGDRGRRAEKPTDIPAKGWKDIARRVFEGIQNDRVLLVAAGVAFYVLLALFPATGAIVSLYGLFADATTI